MSDDEQKKSRMRREKLDAIANLADQLDAFADKFPVHCEPALIPAIQAISNLAAGMPRVEATIVLAAMLRGELRAAMDALAGQGIKIEITDADTESRPQ